MRSSPAVAAVLAAVPILLGFAGDSSPQDPQPPAAAAPAADPADVATVDALVAAVYEVISGPQGQQRDWDRMRSLFHPQARLVPMVRTAAGMRARPMTVADYIERSGPLLERQGFFERQIASEVDRFGDLAHVFSTYEGRRGRDDEPFLRGINSFQLVREQDRWWVLQILWQQEHDAGPIPARYLPGK